MPKQPEKIEIEWDGIPSEVARFVRRELKKCRDNGISIYMPSCINISDYGCDCSGYFNDSPLKFAVGVKGSYRRWLPTFVHESCHMDQWLEQDPVWTRRINRYKPLNLFDYWLSGKIELDKELRRDMIDCVLNIELDCEKRSVDKIIRYNLPISLDTYIRKGNAYVWSYRIMQRTRNWKYSAAHSYPAIWRAMPTVFGDDYSRVPGEIKEAFRSAMRNGE